MSIADDVRELMNSHPGITRKELLAALPHHKEASVNRTYFRLKSSAPTDPEPLEDTSPAPVPEGVPMLTTTQLERLIYLYTRDGAGKTASECALALGEQWPDLALTERDVRAILRDYGITKGEVPVSNFELQREGVEGAEKRFWQKKRRELHTNIGRNEAKEYRKLYEGACRELEDQNRALAIIAGAFESVGPAPNAPRLELCEVPYMVVAACYDVHLGKLDAERRSIEEQVEDWHERARSLINTCVKFGAPKKVTVLFGGDFFNIDTASHTTTSGTPQNSNADAGEIVQRSMWAAAQYIDLWRQVADVEVQVVPGNHDFLLSYALMAGIQMRYADTEGVDVVSHSRTRAYFKWGRTLVMAEHGKDVDAKKLSTTMPTERPVDWGASDHRYVLVGDKHHDRVRVEENGVTVIQMPSLSGRDAWHDKKAFVGARRVHKALIFGEREGLIGEFAR